MSKVISADDAAILIKDGTTIGASALTLAGWPEELSIAMEKRFLASGHPARLTFVHASGIGDWKTRGSEHFAHKGMIARWMGGHTGLAPGLAKMVVAGDCQGYCIPQGVVTPMEVKTVRPSHPDSYEALCHEVGAERFLLDLGAGQLDDLRRVLAQPRLERYIGVIYRPETERWSHYGFATLPDQYDAFVWFDETHAVTPLPTTVTGVEDETYPFGL
jgi:hypothetical protein